jgi:hypothetical protein
MSAFESIYFSKSTEIAVLGCFEAESGPEWETFNEVSNILEDKLCRPVHSNLSHSHFSLSLPLFITADESSLHFCLSDCSGYTVWRNPGLSTACRLPRRWTRTAALPWGTPPTRPSGRGAYYRHRACDIIMMLAAFADLPRLNVLEKAVIAKVILFGDTLWYPGEDERRRKTGQARTAARLRPISSRFLIRTRRRWSISKSVSARTPSPFTQMRTCRAPRRRGPVLSYGPPPLIVFQHHSCHLQAGIHAGSRPSLCYAEQSTPCCGSPPLMQGWASRIRLRHTLLHSYPVGPGPRFRLHGR